MKGSLVKIYLSFMAFLFCIGFVQPVYATDLDQLNRSMTSQSSSSTSQDSNSSMENSITGYLKGYNPVTDENMKNAQVYASPVVSILGTLTGFLVIVVSAGIFVITGLDLMYIGIPPLRKLLNPELAGGTGGMGGQTQPSGRSRLVSDEAVACVAMAGQQGGGAMPQGGGMGGFGGGFGGGMGMQQPQQSQSPSTKSTIVEYLKKRTVFIVVFSVAMIVLTSSVLLDCGINIGLLGLKAISKISQLVSGISI